MKRVKNKKVISRRDIPIPRSSAKRIASLRPRITRTSKGTVTIRPKRLPRTSAAEYRRYAESARLQATIIQAKKIGKRIKSQGLYTSQIKQQTIKGQKFYVYTERSKSGKDRVVSKVKVTKGMTKLQAFQQFNKKTKSFDPNITGYIKHGKSQKVPGFTVGEITVKKASGSYGKEFNLYIRAKVTVLRKNGKAEDLGTIDGFSGYQGGSVQQKTIQAKNMIYARAFGMTHINSDEPIDMQIVKTRFIYRTLTRE